MSQFFGALSGSRSAQQPASSIRISPPINPLFRVFRFPEGLRGVLPGDLEHCWCPDCTPEWDGTEEADVLVHPTACEQFLQLAKAYEAKTGQKLRSALMVGSDGKVTPETRASFDAIIVAGDREALIRFRDGDRYDPTIDLGGMTSALHDKVALLAAMASNGRRLGMEDVLSLLGAAAEDEEDEPQPPQRLRRGGPFFS